MDKNETMYCPVCKAALVEDGVAKMETLNDHVSCNENIHESPKMRCSNHDCETRGVCFWHSLYGEGPYVERYDKFKEIVFIDGNKSPFNSLNRQINAEQDHSFDHKLIIIGKFRWEVYYNIKADLDGNIIKKTPHLRFWIRDGGNGWLLYTPGYKMLRHEFRRFKWVSKFGDIDTHIEELHNEMERYDSKWWRRANYRIAVALRFMRFDKYIRNAHNRKVKK